MKIIDGTAIAKKIEEKISLDLKKNTIRAPALAFLLVGDNPASKAFIRMKKKKCHEVGIRSIDKEFPENTTQHDLLLEIQKLNHDETVDGILVQLPLPPQISVFAVMETISPKKDVDGFHPINVGKMLLGERDGFFPCTPHGIIRLLADSKIETEGKHVVIVGRSNIVGKPLAALLMQKNPHANATVTVAHSATKHLSHICKSADILVAAMGSPHFITASMVKEGAVVIDVGINRVNNKLIGDVDFEKVAPLASHITPVPGGVGPMTIAMLLSNTYLSFEKRYKI